MKGFTLFKYPIRPTHLNCDSNYGLLLALKKNEVELKTGLLTLGQHKNPFYFKNTANNVIIFSLHKKNVSIFIAEVLHACTKKQFKRLRMVYN